jgi:hypothetical protein
MQGQRCGPIGQPVQSASAALRIRYLELLRSTPCISIWALTATPERKRLRVEAPKPLYLNQKMVAGARYVPNAQFLSISFCSELLHCAAQV